MTEAEFLIDAVLDILRGRNDTDGPVLTMQKVFEEAQERLRYFEHEPPCEIDISKIIKQFYLAEELLADIQRDEKASPQLQKRIRRYFSLQLRAEALEMIRSLK